MKKNFEIGDEVIQILNPELSMSVHDVAPSGIVYAHYFQYNYTGRLTKFGYGLFNPNELRIVT